VRIELALATSITHSGGIFQPVPPEIKMELKTAEVLIAPIICPPGSKPAFCQTIVRTLPPSAAKLDLSIEGSPGRVGQT
jgi:hypothetical protein